MALDDLDAAMPACVLERAHTHVGGAQHDDRLIEDLVLDEIVRLGKLLEPARHLPHPRPQQFGLHRVEVRVVVALLARPVRELHRVGHRKCRPLVFHDRHAASLSFGVRCRGRPTHRSVQYALDDDRRRGRRRCPCRCGRAGRRCRDHRYLSAVSRSRSGLLGAVARSRRGCRRHVVLEPLPRRSVRFGELHVRVPVLERAVRRVAVARALRATAGDRALPQPRGRPVRPSASHPIRRQGDLGPLRDGGRVVDRRRQRRNRAPNAVLHRRHGRPLGAVLPGRAGPRGLSRGVTPHRTVAGDAR